MTYKLNLASQPFRNRTLPWTVSIVVAAISLLGIVYVFSESSRIRSEADVAERQVVELRRQKLALEEQANRIQEEIPLDQRRTLKAAHEIVDRKKFSWSQLFADLEESLPSTVRVARINVREVAQRGDQMTAQLDLSVVGRTPTDVTGMITEMSRAGFFSAVPLTETVKNEKGEGGYEWTLRVSYVQRARQGKIEAASSDTEVSASGLDSTNERREAGSRQ